jgi:hypothetical protein
MLHLIPGLGLAIYPGTRPQVSAAKPPASHPNTVRAGDAIVAASRLHPFTLARHLTLTKAKPLQAPVLPRKPISGSQCSRLNGTYSASPSQHYRFSQATAQRSLSIATGRAGWRGMRLRFLGTRS